MSGKKNEVIAVTSGGFLALRKGRFHKLIARRALRLLANTKTMILSRRTFALLAMRKVHLLRGASREDVSLERRSLFDFLFYFLNMKY